MRRIMQTVLLAALLACCLSPSSYSADVPIYPTGPVFQLSGLQWGVSSANGLNNNFVFTPINPQGYACVYVFNNNPTNGHTFTGIIGTNGNPSNNTPSDSTWQLYPQFNGTTLAAVSAPAIFGNPVAGAAKVSINLSGSAVQAGNPDTANVIIIQTLSSCISITSPSNFLANIQPPNSFNQENVSAANTATSITVPAVQGFRNIVFSVSARCSAGTAQLTVSNAGSTVWSTGTTEVAATTFRFQWNPGLTSGQNVVTVITLGACGAANTGTLDAQWSQIQQQ